jgi:hypothetical protein
MAPAAAAAWRWPGGPRGHPGPVMGELGDAGPGDRWARLIGRVVSMSRIRLVR